MNNREEVLSVLKTFWMRQLLLTSRRLDRLSSVVGPSLPVLRSSTRKAFKEKRYATPKFSSFATSRLRVRFGIEECVCLARRREGAKEGKDMGSGKSTPSFEALLGNAHFSD